MQEVKRIADIYRPVEERIKDNNEVERRLTSLEIVQQGSRCHSCGIPFCHGAGCPLGNLVPEFNAAVAAGNAERAYNIISKTGNVHNDPVMVRQIEKYIIETAFEEGRVTLPSAEWNGKTAAVIGSGPAGLFAAEALRRKGYAVTVYEKREKVGGLLRYGIPNWKLDKSIIDRRVKLLEEAGIKFVCSTEIGKDISAEYIHKNFDEVFLAIGTPNARDLKIPGREAEGIFLALDFLHGANKPGETNPEKFSAKGRKVLVIGGGDTGNDCVGKAIREGCESVLQVEFMPKPPEERSPSTPWPDWPYMLRTSYAQHEGGERRWNVSSKQFIVKDGRVAGVEAVRVEWEMSPQGRPLKPNEVPNSTEVIDTDLVVLAMGFTGVPAEGIVNDLGLQQTPRTAIIPDPARHIYAVGDCANGASLVVRAMADAKVKVASL